MVLSKKKTKEVVIRGRSKSVGRDTPKSRSRTPATPRSRSKTPTRRPRTPASESKVRKRRSPSSEHSEGSSKGSTKPKKRTEIVVDRPIQTVLPKPLIEYTGLSRFSEGIVKKIELEQAIHFRKEEQVQKPETFHSHKPPLSPVVTNYRKPFFSPTVVGIAQLIFVVPFIYWLNLLVFAPPHVGDKSEIKSLWGPAHPLFWVMWPTDWRVYFNIQSVAFVSTYLFLHCLIARFIPFGHLANTSSRNNDCRCNGLISFIIFMGLFAFAQMSEYPIVKGLKPSTMIPNFWLGLLTSTCLATFIISFAAFFASRTVTRYTRQSAAKTSSVFLDFWYGRYPRPLWFGIDWKMVVIRSGLTALPLIDMAYIFKQYEQYERVSPALAAHALMHALWVLDFFIFEHAFIYTYEVQSITFGSSFVLGQLVALPFTYSITSSYLSSKPDVGRSPTSLSKHSCEPYTMGISVIVFLLGLWIHRTSSNQKNMFRRDPHHPSFSNAEIIAGPGTQRLLAGGFWGRVRHPNYVGYMIMALAMAIPCGFDSVIPWIIPIFIILFLIHRAFVVEEACLKKHGPAWQKYMALVPYRFIPKVF
ncbi:unnamed protein product [Trichobilharzia szidati]|nr:unnamed protein product [Trichobilharzia szidati]